MLKNKNILVIGATGGIGREVSRLLVQSEANVFLTSTSGAFLFALADQLSVAPPRTMVVDLLKQSDVDNLKKNYFEQLTSIDILINCAGIGILKPVEDLSPDDFLLSLQVNLLGPFLLMKAFLPAMKESRKGLVINIPGVLGKIPMSGASAYSASKYGLIGMMHSIREEVKRTDIRITNLILGGTNSTFWDQIDMRVQREKMVTAADAARSIWFLCQQPESGVVNEMVLQPFNHQAI